MLIFSIEKTECSIVDAVEMQRSTVPSEHKGRSDVPYMDAAYQKAACVHVRLVSTRRIRRVDEKIHRRDKKQVLQFGAVPKMLFTSDYRR